MLANSFHYVVRKLVLLCAALGGVSLLQAEDDRLILLDGETVSAAISGIDAQGRVRGEKVPLGLDLDGLRRIERAAAAPRSAGSGIVLELSGGKLFASGVTIGSDRCDIAWEFGEKLSLPIDVVRAIRFDPQGKFEAFEEALKTPSPDTDRLFVRIDDKVQIVAGLIEELAADKVVFEFQKKKQTLPREKLYGIVTARIGGDAVQAGQSLIELRDGSSLSGGIASLADGVLTLKVSGGSKAELPWNAVAKVTLRSSRVAFLSDLNPTEVVEQALVTTPRPWRRDRSVAGRTLSLGQRTFEKGLGTHALCRLTFAADGKYDFLAATIGIDAETEGRGDCVLSVLGDGKELFSKRFRGADPPHELKLDVRGVKQLTLVVEPGEDLDLADHADWGDARLIRAAKDTSGK